MVLNKKVETSKHEKGCLGILVFAFLFDIIAIFTIQLIEWKIYNGFALSGMCPGGPTDIPPYPCNILEMIFIRGFLNPWAIPAYVLLYIIGIIIALMFHLFKFGIHSVVKKSKEP